MDHSPTPINAKRMTMYQVKLSIRIPGFKSKESIQTEELTRIIEITTKEIYMISK